MQSITRPEGTPIEHTSIPFQISMQGVSQQMNQKYQEDQMADMLKQADMMQTTIDSMAEDAEPDPADGRRHARAWSKR